MIKPDDSEEMGNPPDPPRLGWIERLVIRLVVPKDYRVEFVADLLEEYEEIWRDRGDAAAKSWRREQLRRSVVPLLRRRLERLIPADLFVYFRPLIPLRQRRVGRLLPLLVVVYFLPVAFLGLLLHGVYIGLRAFLILVGRVKSPALSTQRWIAIGILRLLLPGRLRDEFFDNLREERTLIEATRGRIEAKRWYRKQILRSIIPLLLRRLERMIEVLVSEHVFARVIQIALCVYLLPALLAVVLVGVVGIVICFLFDTMRRFPPFGWLWQALAILTQRVREVAKWVIRILGLDRFIGPWKRFSSFVTFALVRHGRPLNTLVWSFASP